MNRLFFPVPGGAEHIDVTGDKLRHLYALRVKKGDCLSVADGAGLLYEAEVEAVSKSCVTLRLGKPYAGDSEPRTRVVLYQALCKGDKNDLIVQKAVELGAAGVVFYHSRNCVGELSDRAQAKLRRWSGVAESAAEQCGREVRPFIQYAGDFKNMLARASAAEQRLFFYEQATQLLSAHLSQSARPESVSVIIGSEGGFTPEEAQSAQDAGFAALSLGRRILRAETAPLAALSILMANYGEM